MDITIDVEDYRLNVRASALIIHNHKVLLHKNKREGHYALLGGRVELGEDSASTVKREIMEEMGKEVELIGYATTIENFFELKGKKYHEIMFSYLAEFVDEKDKLLETPIQNVEGKDYLQYEWVDIDQIDECPLKPKVMKQVLKDNIYPTHKINNDFK